MVRSLREVAERGGALDIPSGRHQLADSIVISADDVHVRGEPGATLVLRFTDRPLFAVRGSGVRIESLALESVQFSRFYAHSRAIEIEGSLEKPSHGVSVFGCEIRRFGGYGIYLRHVRDFLIEGNVVAQAHYAGVMGHSVAHGVLRANRVAGIPGSHETSWNAYGIALTRHGAEPPSTDVVVESNSVEDVPMWEGLDTHGGRNILFRDNLVRRARIGINVSRSAEAVPENVRLERNRLFGTGTGRGIGFTGGEVRGWSAPPKLARGGVIADNIVDGFGTNSDDDGALLLYSTIGVRVSRNRFRGIAGHVMQLYAYNEGFLLQSNVVEGPLEGRAAVRLSWGHNHGRLAGASGAALVPVFVADRPGNMLSVQVDVDASLTPFLPSPGNVQ